MVVDKQNNEAINVLNIVYLNHYRRNKEEL
jgi:hypothetical protein